MRSVQDTSDPLPYEVGFVSSTELPSLSLLSCCSQREGDGQPLSAVPPTYATCWLVLQFWGLMWWLWKLNHLLLCDKWSGHLKIALSGWSPCLFKFKTSFGLKSSCLLLLSYVSNYPEENFRIPGCMCTYAMEILLTESFSISVGLLTVPWDRGWRYKSFQRVFICEGKGLGCRAYVSIQAMRARAGTNAGESQQPAGRWVLSGSSSSFSALFSYFRNTGRHKNYWLTFINRCIFPDKGSCSGGMQWHCCVD